MAIAMSTMSTGQGQTLNKSQLLYVLLLSLSFSLSVRLLKTQTN